MCAWPGMIGWLLIFLSLSKWSVLIVLILGFYLESTIIGKNERQFCLTGIGACHLRYCYFLILSGMIIFVHLAGFFGLEKAHCFLRFI